MAQDISEIKEQKKEELKEELGEKEEKSRGREKLQKKREALKKQTLKKAMTKDARERLGRIRAANEEKAKKIESLVVKLWKSNQIQGKITDEKLKKILKKISSGNKEINIKRK